MANQDGLKPDNFEDDLNPPDIPVTDEDMYALYKERGWTFQDADAQKKFEEWAAKQP